VVASAAEDRLQTLHHHHLQGVHQTAPNYLQQLCVPVTTVARHFAYETVRLLDWFKKTVTWAGQQSCHQQRWQLP